MISRILAACLVLAVARIAAGQEPDGLVALGPGYLVQFAGGIAVVRDPLDSPGMYIDVRGSDGALRTSTFVFDGTSVTRGVDGGLYLNDRYGEWYRLDGGSLITVPPHAGDLWGASSTVLSFCYSEAPPNPYGYGVSTEAALYRFDGSARLRFGSPAQPCLIGYFTSPLLFDVATPRVLLDAERPIFQLGRSIARVNADRTVTTLHVFDTPAFSASVIELADGTLLGTWDDTPFRMGPAGDSFATIPGLLLNVLQLGEDSQAYGFGTISGNAASSIVRLHASGAYEVVFDLTNSPPLVLPSIAIASDGNLFFAGFSGNGPVVFHVTPDGRRSALPEPDDVLIYDRLNGMHVSESSFRPYLVEDQTHPDYSWAPGWTTIAPADFNGDGWTDLLFYNRDTGQFARGTSTASRCCDSLTYLGYNWAPQWEVTVADLTRDGKSDVFLYNQTSGNWFLARSTGDGSGDFLYTPGRWAPGWIITHADWGAAGGGLFLYNPANGQWFSVAFDSEGNVSYPASGTWATGWQVYPADFNADGMTDLFLYATSGANAGRNFRAVWAGQGFTYQEGPRWAPNWQVSIADLDGDGQSDVFLYQPGDGRYFEAFWQGDQYEYYGGTWAAGWGLTVLTHPGQPDALLLDNGVGYYFVVTPGERGALMYTPGVWLWRVNLHSDAKFIPLQPGIPRA